jgi:hypothetical protein
MPAITKRQLAGRYSALSGEYDSTEKELHAAAVHLSEARSQADDDAGDEGQHQAPPELLMAASMHRALAVPAGALRTLLPEHQVRPAQCDLRCDAASQDVCSGRPLSRQECQPARHLPLPMQHLLAGRSC